jgi:hypothetical protein
MMGEYRVHQLLRWHDLITHRLSPSTLRKWRCTHEHPELTWRKRFRHVFYLESAVLEFKELSTKFSSNDIYI